MHAERTVWWVVGVFCSSWALLAGGCDDGGGDADADADQDADQDAADVAGGNHGQFQVRTHRSHHAAQLADRARLRQRIFHEVSGTQVKYVRAADLAEFLFQMMQADDRAGPALLFGSDAAEGNHVLDARLLDRTGDGVADAILIAANIVGREIGRNEDVGGIGAFERPDQGLGVGDIADKNVCALGGQGLQLG